MVTCGKDYLKEIWDALGTKNDRKELDRRYKNANSNFKNAIVGDMWLTGFDVPFLDTPHLDEPI